MFDETDDPIGYGKPPRNHRFQPGVSGNPKGRPKGTPNVATVFRKILHQKVRVNGPDGPRWMPKLEVALNQLVNRALNGDSKAVHELVQWAKTFGDAAPAEIPPKILISFTEAEDGRPAPPRPGEVEKIMTLEEFAQRDPNS